MKKYRFLGLMIFLFISFSMNVKADTCDKYQCITCEAVGNSFTITYDVKANGKGSATVSFSSKINDQKSRLTYKFTESAVAKNFISDDKKKLMCPSNVYYKMSGGGTTTNVELSFTNKSGFSKNPLKMKTKSDNENSFASNNATDILSCDYKGTKIVGSGTIPVTIVSDGKDLTYEISDGYKKGNSDLDASLFTPGKSCPTIYIKCGSNGDNKFCDFSSDPNYVDKTTKREGNEGTESQNADDLKLEGYVPDINELYDPAWSKKDGCAILNDGKTIEVLKEILNYLRLAAVALLLILGSLDFAGAIMSDKDDAMKSAGNKFKKRLIATVIVFLVPALVNIVLFIADKNESICGLLSGSSTSEQTNK